MNYVLQPEVAAQISSKTFYNSPIPAAEPLFAPETREVLNHGFAITNETINRLEWIESSEDMRIFEETWNEIR